MSKEKQIEEMAKALNEATFGVNTHTLADHLKPETINKVAEYLYNAGYRKQSEGEWILTGTFKSTFPLPVAYLHTACSVCRWTPPKYSDDYKEYNYCPNCGAKMKGV